MRVSFAIPLALLSLAVATSASSSARADTNADKPLSTYPACGAHPTVNSEAAHGAYLAGKGSFDVAEYGRALELFKDAYRRDCTKHELLIIIARAYELNNERREAVHALETYLQRVPAAADADVQRQHIANLKQQIANEPTPPPVVVAPAPPPVSAPPPAPAPTEAPQEASGHSAVPWVLVAGGAAAAVVGVVLFASGSSKVSSASGNCPDMVCPPGDSKDQSTGTLGEHLETSGAVVIAIGGAAIVGGLLWHFLEPTRDAVSPASAKGPRFTPVVSKAFTGLSLDARF